MQLRSLFQIMLGCSPLGIRIFNLLTIENEMTLRLVNWLMESVRDYLRSRSTVPIMREMSRKRGFQIFESDPGYLLDRR